MSRRDIPGKDIAIPGCGLSIPRRARLRSRVFFLCLLLIGPRWWRDHGPGRLNQLDFPESFHLVTATYTVSLPVAHIV